MTPKNKAKELYDKISHKLGKGCSKPYQTYIEGAIHIQAKEIVLICIDEILSHKGGNGLLYLTPIDEEYWNEVKQEIEKL